MLRGGVYVLHIFKWHKATYQSARTRSMTVRCKSIFVAPRAPLHPLSPEQRRSYDGTARERTPIPSLAISAANRSVLVPRLRRSASVRLPPYRSLFFFCFSFVRFPLHIFIRRSFLTINADHLHVGSQRGGVPPAAAPCSTRNPADRRSPSSAR